MKILYLAFACNPFVGSEAQCGWSWPMAMREYADVSVLTRKENKNDIEKFLSQNNIKNINVFYCDIPDWLNLYYKKGKLYFPYYLLWQRVAARYAKKLHKKYCFDYIHQVTLGDFRSINPCWKLNTKFIFGPVGGAQVTPDVFKDYVAMDKKTEMQREKINKYVVLIPSYKKALNNCEYVFAANKETQIYLQNIMKYPERCKLLTENGVGKDKLKGFYSRKEKEKVVILWSGRMVNKKGLSFLLDVLSRIKTDKQYVLKLVGDGPEREYLEEKAKRLGLQKKVEFCGKVSYEEMQEIYKESDIFVFPSFRETTGTVLFEAMSNGLPIVTFNQNGADLLINNDCGRKVNINQGIDNIIKEFADNICELINNENLRNQLGISAYNRIKQEYTWEAKCLKFKDEYLN